VADLGLIPGLARAARTNEEKGAMIRRIVTVSFLIGCLSSSFAFVALAGSPVVNTTALGELEFRIAGNQDQENYLGASSEAKLSLAQIKAERLIIVVFNVFCAICQADAPVLNSMHEVIEVDPRLKGKTKLLGIATGNTDAEVEHFRQEHQVPYPLIADPEFSLERAVPEKLRTPMVIIAKNVDGKSIQVIRTHFGGIAQGVDLLSDNLTSAAPGGAHARAPQN